MPWGHPSPNSSSFLPPFPLEPFSSWLTALWNTLHWLTHYPPQLGLLGQQAIDWMSRITNLNLSLFCRLEVQGQVLADLVSGKSRFLLCRQLLLPFLGGTLCLFLLSNGLYTLTRKNFQVPISDPPHWVQSCAGDWGTFIYCLPRAIKVSRSRFLLL